MCVCRTKHVSASVTLLSFEPGRRNPFPLDDNLETPHTLQLDNSAEEVGSSGVGLLGSNWHRPTDGLGHYKRRDLHHGDRFWVVRVIVNAKNFGFRGGQQSREIEFACLRDANLDTVVDGTGTVVGVKTASISEPRELGGLGVATSGGGGGQHCVVPKLFVF